MHDAQFASRSHSDPPIALNLHLFYCIIVIFLFSIDLQFLKINTHLEYIEKSRINYTKDLLAIMVLKFVYCTVVYDLHFRFEIELHASQWLE